MTNGEGAGRESAPPLVVLRAHHEAVPRRASRTTTSRSSCAPGEVHALIGENGAGKSTLMRVLYGMYPADGGRIVVRGKEVRIASPRDAIALGIGMVHQHFVLVDPFTVTENIILGDEGEADPATGRRPNGASRSSQTPTGSRSTRARWSRSSPSVRSSGSRS